MESNHLSLQACGNRAPARVTKGSETAQPRNTGLLTYAYTPRGISHAAPGRRAGLQAAPCCLCVAAPRADTPLPGWALRLASGARTAAQSAPAQAAVCGAKHHQRVHHQGVVDVDEEGHALLAGGQPRQVDLEGRRGGGRAPQRFERVTTGEEEKEDMQGTGWHGEQSSQRESS